MKHGDWSAPVPLTASAPPPPFPTESFPEWMNDWVLAEATATQTPPDLPAMYALACVSVCVPRACEVHVAPGWTEPTNLYLLASLASGNRKSTVERDATAPIRAFERRARAECASEIAEAEAERELLQAKLAAAIARAKKDEGARQEVLDLTHQVAGRKIPVAPRLLCDDITPEGLVVLMATHDGSMAIMSAEGGAFETVTGRYADTPNLDVLLKAHSGDTLHVDRISRQSICVDRPRLVMGLAVQPTVLELLGKKRNWRGFGLLARFLYSVPRSMVGRRQVNPPAVPDEVRAAYWNGIDRLLARRAAVESNSGVRIGADGLSQLHELAAELEPHLGEGGELHSIADWASKHVGATARVAGLLHLAGQHDWTQEISGDTVAAAVAIGRYYLAHARCAFDLMGANSTVAEARHVLAWIDRTSRTRFTQREAYESLKGSFTDVPHLRRALDLLCEHGFLDVTVPDRPGPGRKPSPVFQVNPLWTTRSRVAT